MKYYDGIKNFEVIKIKEGDNITEVIKDERYEYYVVAVDDGTMNKGELGLLEVGEIKTKDLNNVKMIIKIRKEA